MAPTSTGSGSTRSPSGPATRSRSASSVSCSMPVSPRDRQRPTQGVNPSATPRRMTIGAVLAALAPDFPDVTISKIRFLEAEGLITPERTSSGYRTFSPDDLERLRYILTAQRDLFWPLKVIAEALDKLDRGLLPALGDVSPSRPQVPVLATDPDLPGASALRRRGALRMTDAELREASGLDRPTFERSGLRPTARSGWSSRCFPPSAVEPRGPASRSRTIRLRRFWRSASPCTPVSYTHLRAHETDSYLVCRLLLEK